MPSTGRSIAALLLNALVFPGLGSIVGGASIGWTQASFALLLSLLLIVPLQQGGEANGATLFLLVASLAVWAWSIATGVKLVREGRTAPTDQAPAASSPP